MMSNGSRAFWSVCSASYTETPAFSPAMEPELSETPARMVTDAGFVLPFDDHVERDAPDTALGAQSCGFL